ncbi:MAG: hypothetical protein M3X11_05620, partial [Acidobacteriota bacterium]|nr:hypothetical protein [Acidobacteriota bacterium]
GFAAPRSARACRYRNEIRLARLVSIRTRQKQFPQLLTLSPWPLLFVFDDYLLYQQDVQGIEATSRNFASVYLLDLVVLGAWYALVLSTTRAMPVFFTCVAVFFLATTVWDWVFFATGPFLRRVRKNGDLPLVLAAAILASVAGLVTLPFWTYLLTFGLIFVLWRLPSWKTVWGVVPDQTPPNQALHLTAVAHADSGVSVHSVAAASEPSELGR